MAGQRSLEPLERPHGRGPVAAEEQVQQRHQEPDAEPLEEHHEEGARQHRREQERLPDEIRAEKREDFPEFGELLEPGLHRWPVVYGPIGVAASHGASRFAAGVSRTFLTCTESRA